MSLYRIHTQQDLNCSLAEAWQFFSSAHNLETITPEYMNFEVLSSDAQEAIYTGQIIEYTVSPLLGIPMHWVTEITHVNHQKLFIDEQRFGPYSFWHHQHHFTETPNGVHMVDLVHYKLPLGPLGKLAHMLFVKRRLQAIFKYRKQVLHQLFNNK